MSERLDYGRGNRRSLGALGAALVTLPITGAMILLPLLWGPGSGSKYLVAIGFLGSCWALSCLLMLALDRIKRR